MFSSVLTQILKAFRPVRITHRNLCAHTSLSYPPHPLHPYLLSFSSQSIFVSFITQDTTIIHCPPTPIPSICSSFWLSAHIYKLFHLTWVFQSVNLLLLTVWLPRYLFKYTKKILIFLCNWLTSFKKRASFSLYRSRKDQLFNRREWKVDKTKLTDAFSR